MAQSKAAKSLERVFRLTVDMEEPLRDAMDCATALRLIGHGLAAHDDVEGRAITAIAWAGGWTNLRSSGTGRTRRRADSGHVTGNFGVMPRADIKPSKPSTPYLSFMPSWRVSS
jgi:hypothetical protein